MSDTRDLVVSEERSVAEVRAQVDKIQSLMKDVMRPGEHYGVIPGTNNKPSLLKAGAEKLCFTFRLVAEFDITREDLAGGHREYRMKCVLRNMVSGAKVGEGFGSCSTMESKYRWRKNFLEAEAGPLPRGYWDFPKEAADTPKKRNELMVATFGPGRYRAKKTDEGWKAFKVEGDSDRVENPDIADSYNTVLKMAEKRSKVDATINALAASDIFTQDVEDLAPEATMKGAEDQETTVERQGDPPADDPQTAELKQKIADARQAFVTVLKASVFTDKDRETAKKKIEIGKEITPEYLQYAESIVKEYQTKLQEKTKAASQKPEELIIRERIARYIDHIPEPDREPARKDLAKKDSKEELAAFESELFERYGDLGLF